MSENINLQTVQETMLISLWGRAKFSRLYPELLDDPEAVEIIKKVDYDFSRVEQGLDEHDGIAYLVRARNFDRAIGRYVERYPEATVVNVGAGLDTTFSRVDNGKMRWYDLDLPDAITFRQQFIPETPRSTCIAKSVFDYAWFDEVEFWPERGIFFIAGGIFQYFHESEISGLFDAMAKRFPGGEIIFDAASKLGIKMANRMVQKTGNEGAPMHFGLGNPVRQISKWSDRIKGVEWYSFWHDVPRNPRWRKQTTWKMKACDLFKMGKYVQVRFL